MLSIEYSKAFDAARAELLESYKNDEPSGYSDLLRRTLDAVNSHSDKNKCDTFDTGRIKSVSTGSYQGNLYFLITTEGYFGDAYTASVSYGSCSHCDAFEACRGYGDDPDYEGYVRLSLHLFQSLNPIQ